MHEQAVPHNRKPFSPPLLTFPPHSPTTTAWPVMSCTLPQQRSHSDTWFSVCVVVGGGGSGGGGGCGGGGDDDGGDDGGGGGVGSSIDKTGRLIHFTHPSILPSIPSSIHPSTHPFLHTTATHTRARPRTGKAHVSAPGEVRVARHAGAVLVGRVHEALVERGVAEVDGVVLHLLFMWVWLCRGLCLSVCV